LSAPDREFTPAFAFGYGEAGSPAAPAEPAESTLISANSASSAVIDDDRLQALPPLPRDEEGPVFAEPWQAQAFALAVRLSEQGHFTWKEWAAALADELRAAAARGEPDDGSHYYHHWLAALERLVTEKGLADSSSLVERKEAWADAYRHTPHGKPVELQRH
jgi:nitrile hydratase accessory protein